MARFDLRRLNTNGRGVLFAGAAALVTSFLPYVGADLGMLGAVTISAWHGFAILGLLLLFAAAGVVAFREFAAAPLPRIRFGWSLITAVCAGLGTLLVLLRAVTVPAGLGIAWGGYLLLLAGIVETVFAVLGFRASGEKAPWQR